MGKNRKPDVNTRQLNTEGNQTHDLLHTYVNSTSIKETTPCRLEYLKKLYHFNLIVDDDKQIPDLSSSFSDPDIDNFLESGLHGDEFCQKYCIEKSVCSGRVIILFPKTISSISGYDINNASDNLPGVPDPDSFQQNPFWLWNDGIVNRTLLPGEQLFLKNILTILEACYKDYKFSVDPLAYKMNMSVSQLNRKLNAFTGHPAGYLIRLFRLQCSAKSLMEGNKNVSEICFETGFNSLSYFCRSFKKHFGCSPTHFKKVMAEKLNIMRQKDN